MPKPTIVWEIQKGNQNQDQVVTEWEKNRIKNVFKRLDVGKSYIKIKKEISTENKWNSYLNY